MPIILPDLRYSAAPHIESCCDKFRGLCGSRMQLEIVTEPVFRDVCLSCKTFDCQLACGICMRQFGDS